MNLKTGVLHGARRKRWKAITLQGGAWLWMWDRSHGKSRANSPSLSLQVCALHFPGRFHLPTFNAPHPRGLCRGCMRTWAAFPESVTHVTSGRRWAHNSHALGKAELTQKHPGCVSGHILFPSLNPVCSWEPGGSELSKEAFGFLGPSTQAWCPAAGSHVHGGRN